MSPSLDFLNTSRTKSRTKFSIVYNPNYSKQHQLDKNSDRELVCIGLLKKVPNGPLLVCNLGWGIPAAELLIGPIRFHINSRALERLANLDDEVDLLQPPAPKSEDELEHDRRSITIGLSCCKKVASARVPDQMKRDGS
ncbi:hypothetical protein F5B21DRAFT_113035 [Xylaria acuta]|nr:hypothetical protein F5B21DRAFT_113035 [Xylaria acuta]